MGCDSHIGSDGLGEEESSDQDSTEEVSSPESDSLYADFLPLEVGNTWTYSFHELENKLSTNYRHNEYDTLLVEVVGIQETTDASGCIDSRRVVFSQSAQGLRYIDTMAQVGSTNQWEWQRTDTIQTAWTRLFELVEQGEELTVFDRSSGDHEPLYFPGGRLVRWNSVDSTHIMEESWGSHFRYTSELVRGQGLSEQSVANIGTIDWTETELKLIDATIGDDPTSITSDCG